MSDIYKTGAEDRWLDSIAKRSLREAIGIAELNLEQPWAREWIEDRIGTTWLAKSSVVKTAELDVHEALEEFDAKQVAFEEANNLEPGRGVNKFMETEGGRAAYRKYAVARNELVKAGPHQPVAVAKSQSSMAALEAGLTAFCKAKSITKVWTEGFEAYCKTSEGRALADAVNEEQL